MKTLISQFIPARRLTLGVRVGCWVASVCVLSLSSGCARLTPSPESGHSELQMTADSLKLAIREAQRTAGDLRAELEEQRKDLAEAQVARAQLQGMLRETERRLDEARQIIELQREELASAHVERERMAQMLRPLHSRLRQSASVVPYQGKVAMPGAEVVGPASMDPREKRTVWPPSREGEFAPPAEPLEVYPVTTTEESRATPALLPTVVPVVGIRTVVIQDGDTLWRLSRRHKVSLEELRFLNGLPSNLIVTGRTLRLPEPRLHQTESQASVDAPVR